MSDDANIQLTNVRPEEAIANTETLGGDSTTAGDINAQSLPPVDRGKHAWLTLVACFFLEATVWG
jgi:hypothetical protein